MTTPFDRVAFGSHVFPFAGLQARSEGAPPLPLLPVRVRSPSGRWSRPFNAILDTGSTGCLLPARFASDLGFPGEGPEKSVSGAGGQFKSIPFKCDVEIMDAQFPEVTCWHVKGVDFGAPVEERALDHSVLGWDLLRLFDIAISHRKSRIELRLA